MNKIKSLFTFCVLIVALLTFLASCKKDCEHVYDHDCDVDCNECAELREINHSPENDDGDCTTAIKCKNCSSVIIAANNHNYLGEWKSDAQHHWHECLNSDCNVTDEKSAHIKGADGKCTECGYVIESQPGHSHTHAYETPNYDEDMHWLECSCGDRMNEEEHSISDLHDCTTDIRCTSCDYVRLPAKPAHSFSDIHDGSCNNKGCIFNSGISEDHYDYDKNGVCDLEGCGERIEENESGGDIDLPMDENP